MIAKVIEMKDYIAMAPQYDAPNTLPNGSAGKEPASAPGSCGSGSPVWWKIW